MASMAVPSASVFIPAFTDPSEIRPKDDQAIVLKIKREIPMLNYVDELNKHIKDEDSFLYISRISGDRLSVVMKKAEQATMLVEEVRKIHVNDEEVEINFMVAKSVKIVISNAGYCVSNSALKRYLQKNCQIRTFSSVSELKVGTKKEKPQYQSSSGYRRAVYIHPEDVKKLPKGPVKFYTTTVGFNVFFEVYDPKCFICGNTGHFRDDCPNLDSLTPNPITQNSQVSNGNVNINENKSDATSDTERTQSNSFDGVDINQQSSQSITPHTAYTLLTGASPPEKDKLDDKEEQAMDYRNAFNSASKRALSVDSSIDSSTSPKREESTRSTHFHIPPFQKAKQETKKLRLSTESVDREQKKVKNTKDRDDISFQIYSHLEPARAYIGATEDKHNLSFDKVVELMTDSYFSKPKQRRGLASSYTTKMPALIDLLSTLHDMEVGNKMKIRITNLKKALENTGTAPSADLASSSESECAET